MTEKKIDLQSIVNEIGPAMAERSIEHDNNDTFVTDNFELLRQKRVFSALIPAELGGGGASHSEMCLMLRKLAGYCSSTALTLSMHQHLVSTAIWNYQHGNPGQKLLEKVAAKELILISTGANDWLSSSGEMERTEGGYIVTAHKPFASGSPVGNMLITSAQFEDPNEGWQVLHFPVPFSAEGVSIDENWRAMGMRGTGSNTVVFKSIFVPEASVVLRRPRGQYHKAWNVVLTVAMPLITAVYVGIAEKAAEIAKAHAKKKADDSTTHILLGEMENELTTAQVSFESMLAITNNFDFKPINENANAILIRKTISTKAVIKTAQKAMETVGGPSYFRSLGLERLLRDSSAGQFHPLPEKKQQLFSGRMALGLDPIDG